MNELINHEAVCRTAPATPGLLTIQGVCPVLLNTDVFPPEFFLERTNTVQYSYIQYTRDGQAAPKLEKFEPQPLSFELEARTRP